MDTVAHPPVLGRHGHLDGAKGYTLKIFKIPGAYHRENERVFTRGGKLTRQL